MLPLTLGCQPFLEAGSGILKGLTPLGIHLTRGDLVTAKETD